MSSSSINKAVDVVGEVVPQSVRPIAVENFYSRDYQTIIQAGLMNFDFNYFEQSSPSATKDLITYYYGGTFDGDTYTGGSIVGVIAIHYNNSDHDQIVKSGRVS